MPLFKSAQAMPENEVIIYDEKPHPEDVIEMHQPDAFSFQFPHIPDAGTIEVSDGPESGVRETRKEGPKDPWDWKSGGISNLMNWVQGRLNAIPDLSGGETTAIERGISFLQRLNSEISKAISSDYDGEIDVKTMEVARKWIYEAMEKLETAHDKLHESHYKKKKSSGSEDTYGKMVKEARTPYGGGIIVTVPLIISRCARVCINGTVSAGHDLPELYRRQVKEFGLNKVQQAELIQHLEDMGFPIRADRLMLPDDEVVVEDGQGDLASNYYS